MAADSLAAIKAIDFDWTVHLGSVWSDPPFDVPSLHGRLRDEIVDMLDGLNANSQGGSALGWPIVGPGGTGKTHLLSILRREALHRRIGFVLVDMTDVHDFWETVLLGYFNSLQQPCGEGRYLHELLLERFLEGLPRKQTTAELLYMLEVGRAKWMGNAIQEVLRVLNRHHANEARKHGDVIRALLALHSKRDDIASAGMTWLQGHGVEEEMCKVLGFTVPQSPPRRIVESLSWLMSLAGPTVLALDQLDPIVAELNIAAQGAQGETPNEETRVARTIIEKLASGLGALRDVTARTQIVVSCLETTWTRLAQEVSLKTTIDRYEPPRMLEVIRDGSTAQAILEARLAAAYRQAGFKPPYPTWPFAAEAITRAQGLSPRQLLKAGYQHRRHCLDRGEVIELRDFASDSHAASTPPAGPDLTAIEQLFQQYWQEADLEAIVDEKAEDSLFAPLLQTACRCLLYEIDLPRNLGAVVDLDFHGGKTTRPLHARIRLIHFDQGEHEEHFCFRALQRQHARAFQTRLNAAIVQSGIDRRLGFRHLAIVRTTELPHGEITSQQVNRFTQAGGRWLQPTEDELRTLSALTRLLGEGRPQVVEWLCHRRPVSQLAMMAEAASHLAEAAGQPRPPQAPAVKDADDVLAGPDGDADPDSPSVLAVFDSEPTPEVVAVEERESKPSSPLAASSPRPSPLPEAEWNDDDLPPIDASTDEDRSPATSADREILLGWQWLGDRPIEAVRAPIEALQRHTIVLAGSGSGKTVLLRRLIEEAALAGIPSIVLDGANDLATLGDRWPEPPEGWDTDDAAKADAYFQGVQPVVWTPGRESGNPLCLEPLPDLAGLDDEDELAAALEMARDALQPIVAPGTPKAVQTRLAVLQRALKYLADHGGGTLEMLAALLEDFPPDAGLAIQNESKLARDMADRLKSALETDPLLRGAGSSLDPARLLGDDAPTGRVRISILNLVGLRGQESQRQFVNQLAMTLFFWIKKHPSPAGRPLRGLLVIDEAKDYVPSVGTTTCKASLMRLVAQARKYHLGIVFATQHPKEVDNALVSTLR